MFFVRSPSKWDIMLLALKNTAVPFFYVFDIVKDFIQLIILIIAAGGPMLVFNNWISFTSVVSWLNNSIQFICDMNQK